MALEFTTLRTRDHCGDGITISRIAPRLREASPAAGSVPPSLGGANRAMYLWRGVLVPIVPLLLPHGPHRGAV